MSGIETIAALATAASAAASAGLAYSQSKKKPPAAQPVTKQPDPEDPMAQEELKRRRRLEAQKDGREGTNLTSNASGAPVTYGNSYLGQ